VSHRRAYSGADFYIARHQLSIDAGFQENQRLESSLPHAHGRAADAKTEALRLLLQTGQFKVSFKSNPARTYILKPVWMEVFRKIVRADLNF
jgi:hypothetical protein